MLLFYAKERFSQVRTDIQNTIDDYNDDDDPTESQNVAFQSYEVEVVDIGRRMEATAASAPGTAED